MTLRVHNTTTDARVYTTGQSSTQHTTPANFGLAEFSRALNKHRKHHKMFRALGRYGMHVDPNGPDLRLLVQDDTAGEPIQWVISGRRNEFSQSTRCYWCWRWRVTRCWHLICEKCTAENEHVGTVFWWQLVWSKQIQHTRALDHNGNPLNLDHLVNRSNPDWNPFNQNWDLLTKAVIDGRVYATGLLGWLQSPGARGSELTRCTVTNPRCDRCQALVEPPWYPNNKHRAVIYFKRVLGQQPESFSYIFAMLAEALATYLANAWEP